MHCHHSFKEREGAGGLPTTLVGWNVSPPYGAIWGALACAAWWEMLRHQDPCAQGCPKVGRECPELPLPSRE